MITQKELENIILKLIEKTSYELPDDVLNTLHKAKENEKLHSPAYNTLEQIIQNVELAKNNRVPICQDTGTNIYKVYYPYNFNPDIIEQAIINSTILATEKAILRPNMVDPLTGVNTNNNIGINHPLIYLYKWDKDYIDISLMLKGGGSENVGTQYKLPYDELNASRDLKGVKKCVLDAVFKAQGEGCAPGIIGVGIGGDRATGYKLSKEQFWRKLDDINPIPELAELENELLNEINSLGIGPMGLGGKTTCLGVKVGYMHRVPASYFVSVSYLCWAARRQQVKIFKDGVIF